MTSLTIKNIPAELYQRLKELAESNHRSLNREMIACIEHAVACQKLDTDATLLRARRLREKTAAYLIGDEELAQAIAGGRP